MHFLKVFVTSLVALVATVSAIPLVPNLAERITESLEARQISLSIRGVTANGGPRTRLEIRQMQRNGDLFNIYLLGLARMQNMDQRNPLSWFQIAAIHGRPYVAWDNVLPITGGQNSGYCTHSSNIFLTWHRPYLALFEQSLYANVLDAVNEFRGADRDRFARAAANFRMPYYDAALENGQDSLPEIVTRPRVWVTTPAGRREIPNPLFAYTFRPLRDLTGNAPFSAWPSTLRHPTSTASNAVSRNDVARLRLNNGRRGLKDRMYTLFRTYSNFSQFGNSAWYPDNSGRYDSVESIHDAVHVMVGGSGHMGFVDYAGFEPLFWLHHANIDRYFAMWQVLYPNSYVQPQRQRLRSFTYLAGSLQDVNSRLTPFHADVTGRFWTSATVRSTLTFNYNYPETANNANADAVRRAVNSLYGPPPAITRVKRGLITAPPTNSTNATMPESHEWFVNIASQKHAMGGTYSVYVFLNEPESDPASWGAQPNLVGTHSVFSATSDCDIAEELRESDVKTAGVVPLSTALYAEYMKGNLDSLDEKEVVPYLQQKLHWRCSMADDTEIKCEDIRDFEFTVVSAHLGAATRDTEFPQRVGDVVEHKEVSMGRPGGAPCYCP